MTTATAALCGHRWRSEVYAYAARYLSGVALDEAGPKVHRCTQPADHPPPCRCRCGATTTRPTEGER